MKYIIAIIKPFKLQEVRDALHGIGVAGLTVSEVKGFGRQKGQTEVYRGAEYEVAMLPKLRLELAVSDTLAARVMDVMREAAGTGSIGDGKLFMFELADAVRIRTGERGEDAL